MLRFNNSRTPSPPTSPPGPTYEHSSHRLDMEWGADLDGYGVDEAEDIDGEPLCVVRAVRGCRREGCEEQEVAKHFFTLSDVPADAQRFYDRENYDLVEECAVNAVIADWDHDRPLLAVVMGDKLSEQFTATDTTTIEASSTCYGVPEEPSPEPGGL